MNFQQICILANVPIGDVAVDLPLEGKATVSAQFLLDRGPHEFGHRPVPTRVNDLSNPKDLSGIRADDGSFFV